MAQQRVPASMLKKTAEKAKQMPKVKITGSASTPPRISSSMIKSLPRITSTSKSEKPKILGSIKPIKTPMPKTTKKGITVAISRGVTMDAKTGIKTTTKPTPKAIPTKSDAQYFADQKKFLASKKNK